MPDFRGRTALVTGASRGIGRETALQLAAAGADVVVNYHLRHQEARAVADEIRSLGRRSLAVAADVGQSGDVAAMFSLARKELGPVTLLINNAGMVHDAYLMYTSDAAWEEMMAVSLKGCFNCLRAALPHMESGGSVVNVSSQAGLGGDVMRAAYSSAKGAVLGLTRSAALELAPLVRVNAVAPGMVETELLSGMQPTRRKRLLDMIPAGRFGAASEVAAAIVFLLGAEYITGQVLPVGGGLGM